MADFASKYNFALADSDSDGDDVGTANAYFAQA